jgi:tRNA (guanine-N7-)-methyltransferase
MKTHPEDSKITILTGEYRQISLPDSFTELDLGCGKGSFTTALADKYPERAVIAADIMIGRLRKLAKRAERMKLLNITLLRVEAGILVSRFIPQNTIGRLHILCPDPWPKAKHKGHRLLSSEFIGKIAIILRKGGVFHFSTDDKNYFASVSTLIEKSGLFEENNLTLIDDILDIKTDFEKLWESEGKKVEHAAWRVKNCIAPEKGE